MFRYHHCLSFLHKKNKNKNKKIKKKTRRKKEKEKKDPKKKEREKEKERGYIHNQSINHWCITHLSCILEGLYG